MFDTEVAKEQIEQIVKEAISVYSCESKNWENAMKKACYFNRKQNMGFSIFFVNDNSIAFWMGT